MRCLSALQKARGKSFTLFVSCWLLLGNHFGQCKYIRTVADVLLTVASGCLCLSRAASCHSAFLWPPFTLGCSSWPMTKAHTHTHANGQEPAIQDFVSQGRCWLRSCKTLSTCCVLVHMLRHHQCMACPAPGAFVDILHQWCRSETGWMSPDENSCRPGQTCRQGCCVDVTIWSCLL